QHVTDEPHPLLSRDPHVAPVRSETMATLSAIVEVSRVLGGVLLGDGSEDLEVQDSARLAAGAVVAQRVAQVAARSPRLSSGIVRRLREVETILGERFVDEIVAAAAAHPSVEDLLVAG